MRRWRDLAGVPAATVLPARPAGAAAPHELVARLARLSFDGADAEPLTAIGAVEILASAEIDPAEASARIEAERDRLRGEIDRAERKLANEGFVAKAPREVVAEEREKLERYRRELDELG